MKPRTTHRNEPHNDWTNFAINTISTTFLTIIVSSAILPFVASYTKHADLHGDFCRTRRDPCCTGRYDDCSEPILGTLCYCDEFCNRTQNPDCCPDYWEACLGLKPESVLRCNKDGRYYQPGERVKENCRECTCGKDGQMRCDNERCIVEEDLMREINNAPRQFGWTASNYSDFWGRKLGDGFTLKTGTLMPQGRTLQLYPVKLFYDRSIIPRYFDARTKWVGNVMGARDQGWCGSSWAFSTLDVYTDRLAIESDGAERDVLSPQNLLSCARRGQQGCSGGYVERAWQYLRKIGVVNEQCYQYESGSSGKVSNCRLPRRPTLQTVRCGDNNNGALQAMKKRKSMYRSEPSYRISSDESDIMYEIMSNGPVQALMRVYDDFFLYRSGIYSHSGLGSGQSSTHSVRVVGWGEDNTLGSRTQKYWIAANSWGQDWGERGFFKIRRGANESDIETFVLAVRAILDQDNRISRFSNSG